jgi:endogenous inhibitor of DNA gyrase (YacG/DUF329 family)
VKIIKQGKLPNEEVFQGECTHCGTIVEFQRKEAATHADCLVVSCPLCQSNIKRVWGSI